METLPAHRLRLPSRPARMGADRAALIDQERVVVQATLGELLAERRAAVRNVLTWVLQ